MGGDDRNGEGAKEENLTEVKGEEYTLFKQHTMAKIVRRRFERNSRNSRYVIKINSKI